MKIRKLASLCQGCKLQAMRLLFPFLVSTLLLHVVEARDFRDFTSVDGKTIHAELIDYREGEVRIRSKGKVFILPIERLSEEDRVWLHEWDLKRRGDEENLYFKKKIFADDFSRRKFGEEWSHYKSGSVIQDGVLIGKTIDIDDHAGVDMVSFDGEQDLQVSVKFRFASSEAKHFDVWFDDRAHKGSHVGHICVITVSPRWCSIKDAKTGEMKNEIREMRKSPDGLDAETKELLKSKRARFDLKLEKSKDAWHQLLIRTRDDVATIWIDGKKVGTFQSEGIAHETKSVVSLTTTVNDVHYDDLEIKAGRK